MEKSHGREGWLDVVAFMLMRISFPLDVTDTLARLESSDTEQASSNVWTLKCLSLFFSPSAFSSLHS